MSTEEKDIQKTFLEKLLVFAPWIIAIVILVGYARFVKYLIDMTGAEHLVWERATYVFASIEAIVFTAVGFIFGKEVNKSRVAKAEKDEQKQKQQKNAIAKALLKLQVSESSSGSQRANTNTEEIIRLKNLAELYLDN